MAPISAAHDGEHYLQFARALRNTLLTSIAELTFGQILDGLPVTDVACENQGTQLREGHPVLEHKELCPGVLDRLRDFQTCLTPSEFDFDDAVSARILCSRVFVLTCSSF
jgi:hypothetical protein